MSKKELTKLILTINLLKAGMDRMDRFLLEHENDDITENFVAQIESRRQILNDNYIKFSECQIQLLYLDPHAEDKSDWFETQYHDILSKIALRLPKAQLNVSAGQPSGIITNQPAHPTSSSSSSISATKLPHIDIPTFDGKCLNNFKPFLDIFTAVIDKNTNLSDVERLFYLRNYLKGEAFTLINTLPIVNSSYKDALDILKNRYDNETMLINCHINSILDIPNMLKGSPSAVREFVSMVNNKLGHLKI